MKIRRRWRATITPSRSTFPASLEGDGAAGEERPSPGLRRPCYAGQETDDRDRAGCSAQTVHHDGYRRRYRLQRHARRRDHCRDSALRLQDSVQERTMVQRVLFPFEATAGTLEAITPALTQPNASRIPNARSVPKMWSSKSDAIVTTDFFAFDDSTNYYKLQGLRQACDMGDAMVASALQGIPNLSWYAVRNASDPQIANPATTSRQPETRRPRSMRNTAA